MTSGVAREPAVVPMFGHRDVDRAEMKDSG